jgi:16S rRNA (cytosine1402-N4)-methyltransferase
MDHYPVLLSESLEWLAIRPDSLILDCTAGLAGHTGAIARQLTTGRVIANDRDLDSIAKAKENTKDCADRIHFVHGPFSALRAALDGLQISSVDGLLADLGVSRYQLTDPERGFSLSGEGPLDMRADRTQDLTAADLVNFSAEKELADLIYQYGEERRARRIARAILRARPIKSTLHLAKVVETVAPRTGRLHPATQTFMALRLAVNQELEELDSLLDALPTLVKDGGRVVIISFMSLEDRRVKQKFQQYARDKRARILTKHVVRPSEDEVETNPASRSARLRAIEICAIDN